jgi:hypothetical protein
MKGLTSEGSNKLQAVLQLAPIAQYLTSEPNPAITPK